MLLIYMTSSANKLNGNDDDNDDDEDDDNDDYFDDADDQGRWGRDVRDVLRRPWCRTENDVGLRIGIKIL